MSRASGPLDLRNQAGAANECRPSNTVMMKPFETKRLPDSVDAIAPDGSEVRLLLQRPAGSMAHFELQPGRISKAVTHRTVEEIWLFLSGEGEMWRKQSDDTEEIVRVEQGTMPPWPGDDEAEFVNGKWSAA
jgi:mannose-6-phosphate isomerase-like protein (cupin superfamily)